VTPVSRFERLTHRKPPALPGDCYLLILLINVLSSSSVSHVSICIVISRRRCFSDTISAVSALVSSARWNCTSNAAISGARSWRIRTFVICRAAVRLISITGSRVVHSQALRHSRSVGNSILIATISQSAGMSPRESRSSACTLQAASIVSSSSAVMIPSSRARVAMYCKPSSERWVTATVLSDFFQIIG
jgi:hypothetical protein